MKEYTVAPKTITVETYITEDGPTCSANLAKNHFCRYLMTRRMGTEEYCIVTPPEYTFAGRSPILERRGKDGCGYIIPGEWCPFHGKGAK